MSRLINPLSGALRSALIVFSLTSCSLFDPFLECEQSADCGAKGVCLDSGLCVELNLEVDPCIGNLSNAQIPSSCRAQLEKERNTHENNVGGCFFLQTEGYQVVSTSFRWVDHEIRLDEFDPVLVQERLFNTHLYFMRQTGAEPLDCSLLTSTLADACSAIQGCVAKLTSPAQVFRERRMTVAYKNEDGSCGLTLNQSLLPVEFDGDYVDNDCDGAVDEDQQRCSIGLGLCLSEGAWTTSLTGERICVAEAYAPQMEACDSGYDEDCDGRVDEGFELLGQPCSVMIEGVARGGLYGCSFDRLSLECKTNAPDLCDNVDTDGDGAVDEDHEVTVVSCPANSCGSSAYQLCQAGALVDTCVQQGSSSGPDICDGVDNDCDGRIDEAALTEAVLCGEFACERPGQRECQLGREVLLCTPGTPQGELCDERDNDCDGRIDEELDDCGEQCSDEVCDGVDNDCDTLIDEGLMNDCGTCGPAPAELACDQVDNDCDGAIDEVAPPAERCDPIDNDCDGRIDEGLPDCPLSVMRACTSSLVWTNEAGDASQQLAFDVGLSPLTPSWETSRSPNDRPFVPKEGDSLALQMSCVDDQGWGTWIQDHCAMSLVFTTSTSDREYRSQSSLNPRDCTHSSGDISDHCVTTSNDLTLTLTESYENFGLHFSCPTASEAGPVEQEIEIHLLRLFKYKLQKKLANSAGDCPLPTIPCTGCQELNRGQTYYAENMSNCDALYFAVELTQ